jgi:hypothetical protein
MDRTAALALYEKLAATNPRVERKGDTTSQYGSVQPEYVVVPDALLAKTQES